MFLALICLAYLSACQRHGDSTGHDQTQTRADRDSLTGQDEAARRRMERALDTCVILAEARTEMSAAQKSRVQSCLQKMQRYVQRYPEQQRTPDYHLSIAHMYHHRLHQPTTAVRYYRRFYQKYPNDPRAPMALFMTAFIYDDLLQQDEKAGNYYRTFLERYPDHEMAESVRLSLEHLGKSDQELIEEFKARQEDL